MNTENVKQAQYLFDKEKTTYKIRKLKCTLQALKEGSFVHITCLMPICYFLKQEDSRLAYAKFLITSSFELYKTGKSISVENKVSEATKYNLYETLLQCLDDLTQNTLNIEQINKIIKSIQVFYPWGWRRIFIHATRRKVFDVDLALLEECARMLQREKVVSIYGLIEMTKYFCVNYDNLRYRMNQDSIPRFERIIKYFSQSII
ncbi:MAG: hypothetical protein QX189_06335 [Methylococcales bacterium]